MIEKSGILPKDYIIVYQCSNGGVESFFMYKEELLDSLRKNSNKKLIGIYKLVDNESEILNKVELMQNLVNKKYTLIQKWNNINFSELQQEIDSNIIATIETNLETIKSCMDQVITLLKNNMSGE